MTIARRFHRVGNVATRYYMAEALAGPRQLLTLM